MWGARAELILVYIYGTGQGSSGAAAAYKKKKKKRKEKKKEKRKWFVCFSTFFCCFYSPLGCPCQSGPSNNAELWSSAKCLFVGNCQNVSTKWKVFVLWGITDGLPGRGGRLLMKAVLFSGAGRRPRPQAGFFSEHTGPCAGS